MCYDDDKKGRDCSIKEGTLDVGEGGAIKRRFSLFIGSLFPDDPPRRIFDTGLSHIKTQHTHTYEERKRERVCVCDMEASL
jgi:hypothetical protein